MLSWSSSEAAQPRELTTVTFSEPPLPTILPGPPNGEQGGFAVEPFTVPEIVLLPSTLAFPLPFATAVTSWPLTFSVALPAYVALKATVVDAGAASAEAAKAAHAAVPTIAVMRVSFFMTTPSISVVCIGEMLVSARLKGIREARRLGSAVFHGVIAENYGDGTTDR